MQVLAEVGHRAAVAQVDADGTLGARVGVAAQRALDPGALGGDERLDVAQRHAARDDDLHPIGVDDDARVTGAIGAPDAVFELVQGDLELFHGDADDTNGVRRSGRARAHVRPIS